MKLGLMLSLLFLYSVNTNVIWETDLQKAKNRAKTEKKVILLNFSGSDWCGKCIKLKKELFVSDTFENYSEKYLILLNADFPTKKKNKQSTELKSSNELLAETYNPKGVFPLTVILDKDGKVLGEMQYPLSTAEDYLKSIKKIMNND